jgi:hypothetical protein
MTNQPQDNVDRQGSDAIGEDQTKVLENMAKAWADFGKEESVRTAIDVLRVLGREDLAEKVRLSYIDQLDKKNTRPRYVDG